MIGLKVALIVIGLVGIALCETLIVVLCLYIANLVVPEPATHPLRAVKVSQCALAFWLLCHLIIIFLWII